MKKPALVFALSLVVSSAFAWGIPSLPSVPTPPAVPTIPGTAGAPEPSAAPAANPAAPAAAATPPAAAAAPAETGLPVFKKSCPVVRGEAWKKVSAISYQPDPMNGAKFVSKEKLLKVLTDDGFTCQKSTIVFDKKMYDAKMVCNKPYTGGGTYKWVVSTIQCKGDTCDEPGISCAEKKAE